MNRYNPKDIEPRWQQAWADSKIYEASDSSDKPKKYVMEFFPYPSGVAMHVGHVRNYTIGDVIARFNRMQGYNVLHPMGWDAFGLPAENFAIKNQISPRVAIDQNTARFKQQLTQMGFSHDWSREIDSTDPDYYKWTQWFFLLLFKKGLAYQQESLQWWCPFDKTVLANEQVEAGLCWRCGNHVEKKSLKQWFFKITDYADRLLDDLEDLDWSDSIKAMQRNWIGRSNGAEIDFKLESSGENITVFTTRPDTLYGATFLVLAPEHSLVSKLTNENTKAEVEAYIHETQAKSEIERQETSREKTGVFTGSHAINPVTGKPIQIWIADYVLTGYGTGAIMAVPAHDERDMEFAEKFDLPIVKVIETEGEDTAVKTHEGVMINSDSYNKMTSAEARDKIIADLSGNGQGKEVVNYRLRDWLISRQRYWGAPIPIIHCPVDGAVPVPEDQLPVVLPELKVFEPADDGRSPLANVPEFVNTTCPKCGGKAERETDTMDGFACSSWYFLRFADPHNSDKPFDKEKVKQWLPVDDYIGGAEHAVMHLLYARFWTKVMKDEGMIDFDEPFKTLRNQGMILAPDGNKMSKSKGNTIEPDSLIEQGYGADSIRIMELFIGPWNQAANWSVEGLGGAHRFLQRTWNLVKDLDPSDAPSKSTPEVEAKLKMATHKTIKKVTADFHSLSFNTAIAALMEYVNDLYKLRHVASQLSADSRNEAIDALIQMLAPVAPHIAEELWQEMGHKDTVHLSEWPSYNEKYIVSDTVVLIIQVNGKLRSQITLPKNVSEEDAITSAKNDKKVIAYLDGSTIKKTIYVQGKIVNFVV